MMGKVWICLRSIKTLFIPGRQFWLIQSYFEGLFCEQNDHVLLCAVSAGDSRSLPRHDSKDRDGRSSPVSSRLGRSSVSPTMMLSGGGGESKTMVLQGPMEDVMAMFHIKTVTGKV